MGAGGESKGDGGEGGEGRGGRKVEVGGCPHPVTRSSPACPRNPWNAVELTLAGLEPAIFGSEDQRLIH